MCPQLLNVSSKLNSHAVWKLLTKFHWAFPIGKIYFKPKASFTSKYLCDQKTENSTFLLIIWYLFPRYRHFAVILVSSYSPEHQLKWCGLVESRLRHLVTSLEDLQHVISARINTKSFDYTAQFIQECSNGAHGMSPIPPGRNAQCTMWFIGLEFKTGPGVNVDLTDTIRKFTGSVCAHAVSFIFLHIPNASINNFFLCLLFSAQHQIVTIWHGNWCTSREPQNT